MSKGRKKKKQEIKREAELEELKEKQKETIKEIEEEKTIEEKKKTAVKEKAEEINLEALTEQKDEETEFSDFSQFISSYPNRVIEVESATLKSTGERQAIPETPGAVEPAESLEQEALSAPVPIPDTTEQTMQEKDYIMVYNEPRYRAGSTVQEENILSGVMETGMFLQTAEDITRVQPRVHIEETDELRQIRETQERQQGGLRDYITEVRGRREETDRRELPFKQKPEREYFE